MVLNYRPYRLLRQLCLRCKLYHKTTWFETEHTPVGWFVTVPLQIISQNYVVWNFAQCVVLCSQSLLQIISQNYVVWNWGITFDSINSLRLQIISQNYVVWNARVFITSLNDEVLQIISQNYVVWNFFWLWFVTGFLVKLQIISQNYVAWNQNLANQTLQGDQSCKLYHKTTWFETRLKAL